MEMFKEELVIKNKAIENSINAIAFADLEGNLDYVNPAFVRTWGYEDKSEVLGRPAIEFWENPEEAIGVITAMQEKGQWVGEMKAKKKDNSIIYIQLTANMIFADDGLPICMMASFVDISDRIQTEIFLKRSNRHLRMLSECNQSLIRATEEDELLKNICDIIIQYGGYIFTWIGYAENDLQKTVRPIIYSGFGEEYIKNAKITWDDSEYGQGPAGFVIRTGEVFINRDLKANKYFEPWKTEAVKSGYASSIALPLKKDESTFGTLNIYSNALDPFDEGEVKLLVELADDISYGIESLRNKREIRLLNSQLEHKVVIRTQKLQNALNELKSTQTRLLHSEKMASLGALSAGIAHEINNSINFINSGVEGLKSCIEDIKNLLDICVRIDENNIEQKMRDLDQIKSEFDFAETLESIELLMSHIQKGIERTTEIIDSLKSFSRLEDKDLREINLHSVIDSTLIILYNEYKNNIEVIKEYNSIPNIEVYSNLINQVFMNILTNAIQAIEGKGKIFIKTIYLEETSEIVIYIRDTGKGVSDEIKERIFEPFFTTKEVGKGTGLGLSISYSIIEKHKGRIEIDNSYESGVEFIIYLPIYSKKDEKNEPPN